MGVGASGAIYAIMGGWLSHITCTWGEEDEFDKFGQAVQVKPTYVSPASWRASPLAVHEKECVEDVEVTTPHTVLCHVQRAKSAHHIQYTISVWCCCRRRCYALGFWDGPVYSRARMIHETSTIHSCIAAVSCDTSHYRVYCKHGHSPAQ